MGAPPPVKHEDSEEDKKRWEQGDRLQVLYRLRGRLNMLLLESEGVIVGTTGDENKDLTTAHGYLDMAAGRMDMVTSVLKYTLSHIEEQG